MSIISYIFIQDFLGKSDPYLELARSKEDGTFVVVHRTEVIDIVVMLFGALIYKKKSCIKSLILFLKFYVT